MRYLPLFFAACAATSPTTSEGPTRGSRGMRADAHQQAARDHERRAAELARWPAMQRDATGFEDPAAGGLWYRKWETTADERRMADHHSSEAAHLQAAYDEACRGITSSDVRVSPLQRYGLGGFPSAEGAVIMLSTEAGPQGRLLAAIRCHRAWMMLGEAGMDDCPLDLAGIKVEAYGDETGISVEIKVADEALVPELQRRAAKDLERSMAHAMR